MVFLKNEFVMTIGGTAVRSDETIPVMNPATEEVIGYAPDASKEHLNQAVRAARNAFPEWAAKSFDKRSKLIDRLGDAILEHKKELAHLLTLEQGKPLVHNEGEIAGAANFCKGFAKQRLTMLEIVEETQDYRIEKHYTPIGVIGNIVPWNAPVALAMLKIPQALLVGNTVIVKPSPYTPLSTLRIGELAREIFPGGVLNVLSGGDRLGPWITEHPDIDKVSFTGSTDTGKKVMQGAAASNLKRVTLELGGNDAAIVLPDVDPKEIAPKLFWGSFRNSGQICVNAKRLYVHESIYDEVMAEMVNYAKTATMGNGLDPSSMLGPVQNKMQYEKVWDIIEDAKREGLTIALGGERIEGKGYFIPITIIDNPPEDSRVVKEEPFGPIVPLLKYKTYDEVIERANNSFYGLGGSVWGKDMELAQTIARRLETGTVWINEVGAALPVVMPFGGHKQSGIGLEGGKEGLIENTNMKVIKINKKN